MSIAILKYNAGNVQSVQFALKRLGTEAILTDDEAALRAASHVIIPGVGEAGSAMECFRAKGLDQIIPSLTQPVLGICLGLQVLCAHSEEGDTDCLGVFGNRVRLFKGDLKVPQIGWNTVEHQGKGIFSTIPDSSYFYYVHGFYAELSVDTIARTEYIKTFSAALKKDNFHAVQFHPEKSADVGERLLSNFLADS